MCGDSIISQPLRQVMRHALSQSTRVNKYQRGTVLPDEIGNTLVNLIPHFIGSDRPKGAGWNFDGEIELSFMTDIDDGRSLTIGSGKKFGDRLNRFLGC